MRLLLALFVLAASQALYAQNACPDCIIILPDSLPQDALYRDSLLPAVVGQPYDQTISFRLPMTTTPVSETDSTTPPNIGINRIQLVNTLNIPPGLNWELSNDDFMVQDSTDGCARICGTPLLPGLYEIEVQLRVTIGPIITNTQLIVPLLVEPSSLENDGFTAVNTQGCGSVTTSFINNNPATEPGFDYLWDFGQGDSSRLQSPEPVLYDEPGEYIVNYEAVVDTASYWLTNVEVLETSCNDLLGTLPDLMINVFDPLGNLLYASPIVDNTETPLDFSTFVELGPGNYSVQVVDEDSGLGGGDDECGTVSFTQTSSGIFIVGDLRLELTIYHPVDTIRSSDTILVYDVPAEPLIDPDGIISLCEGETVDLMAINYDSNLVWTVDGLPLDVDTNLLTVGSEGNYQLSYTSPDGCVSMSDAVWIQQFPVVAPSPLEVHNGSIRIVDGAALPPGLGFEWFLDAEPLAIDTLRFCPTVNGVYTLRVTDEQTGCSVDNQIEISHVEELVCDTPVEELLDREGWLLYPNPSIGYNFLALPEGSNYQVLQLTLTDALGRQVWQRELEPQQSPSSLELDWTRMAAGSYRLLVRSPEGLRVFPVLLR